MRTCTGASRLVPAVVLLAAFVSLQCAAQNNLALLVSSPGDYIGAGRTYVTTNDAEISISGNANTVTISAFGFWMNFDARGEELLAVGNYPDAHRYPFNFGDSPGISVYGNGRGCNTVCGEFKIMELHVSPTGLVDRFWVSFTHICECGMAPLTGEVRYHSSLAPPTPAAKIVRVPGDYATIQAAISNSSLLVPDTILVGPGTYKEAVSFGGRRARVVATDGPASTIIAPPSGSIGVMFTGGEDTNALLSGFTITNGTTGINVSGGSSPLLLSNLVVGCGRGIDVGFASPLIISNTIQGCTGDGVGLGGASTPYLEGNVIRSNAAAGVSMFAAGTPVFKRNIINGNSGPGMTMVNQADAEIIQNLIYENKGAGIAWLTPYGTRGPVVYQNTIVANVGPGISADGYDGAAAIVGNIVVGSPALYVGGFNDHSPPALLYNDFYARTGNIFSGEVTNLAGINGNITAEPLFVCRPSWDFHLLPGSPAIDAGTNTFTATQDFDLKPRELDGDTNGVVRIDMGAFEYDSWHRPEPCMYITCPADLVVFTQSGETNAVVNYPPPEATPAATVICVPPSGSTLSGGTTVVNCTATYGTNTVSCSFNVTVLVQPKVLSPGQNIEVVAGDPVSLSVEASGTAPLSYQWYFETVPLPGATNATLNIPAANFGHEGFYGLTVSNRAGTVGSPLILLRVLPRTGAPVFAINLSAETAVVEGSTLTLDSLAAGSAPLTYTWYFRGTNLLTKVGTNWVQQTQARLKITPVSTADAGPYFVVASNQFGMVTSVVANVTILEFPRIASSTLSNSVAVAGTGIALQVTATGTPPLSYGWTFNGMDLPGETNASLNLTNLQASNSGYYQVVVTNKYGSLVRTARVWVVAPPSALSAWGDNSAGQTSVPAGLNDAVAVAGGDYHSVAARLDGTLAAWGSDDSGQLQVPAGTRRFVALACGSAHTLAITDDGNVLAWGRNDSGQTVVPAAITNQVLAVAAGDAHSLVLLRDGLLAAWGNTTYGQGQPAPYPAMKFKAIAAGRNHNVAVKRDGTVVAWGLNTSRQATVPPLAGVKAVVAGYMHSAALLTNGTVVAWGDNTYGQTNVPPNVTNVVSISAGDFHTVALLADGHVLSWGNNSFGQTNVPPTLPKALAVASGYYHALALVQGSLLRYTFQNGEFVVTWDGAGTLEAAPLPSGPYTNVSATGQAYTNSNTAAPALFFRLKQ